MLKHALMLSFLITLGATSELAQISVSSPGVQVAAASEKPFMV
jgi:hypothetical protein